jgi:crotonobetainyl-CoA:carnitine CoA-transferase CaiB-like acyl-CoA transferase
MGPLPVPGHGFLRGGKMLSKLRILDVTNYLSGPFASLNLAFLGAEVIKVERPGIGDPCRWNPPFANPSQMSFEREAEKDVSLIFLKRNRGKKSITLNLKSEKGRDIFRELAQMGDIVLENFPPGVMDRLGVGYGDLKKVNPKLIYCAISGFGQSGPYKDFPAYDLVIQALSGAMAITGYADGPPLRCGIFIGDQVPGLYAIIGILSAVIEREQSGKGRQIDISMQDCLFSMVTDDTWELNLAHGLPVRSGNQILRLAPFDVYPSKDGHVVICVASDDQWQNLIKAIGREDLKEDARYREAANRVKNKKEVGELIGEWVRGKNTQEAVETLRRNRISCSAVSEMDQVLNDPQLKSRNMIVELLHPTYGRVPGASAAGFPIKISNHGIPERRPAPLLGQNNDEIYSQLLKFDREKLLQLREEGVI